MGDGCDAFLDPMRKDEKIFSEVLMGFILSRIRNGFRKSVTCVTGPNKVPAWGSRRLRAMDAGPGLPAPGQQDSWGR